MRDGLFDSDSIGKYVLGLGGGTNSGKTTICTKLCSEMPTCTVINQDDYFKTLEEAQLSFPGVEVDWETCEALWMDRLVADVKHQSMVSTTGVLIVEGHLVLSYPPLVALLDRTVFIEVSYDLAKERRLTRTYDPPDRPGYFDNVVWPGYERIVDEVRYQVEGVMWLDADNPDYNYSRVMQCCHYK